MSIEKVYSMTGYAQLTCPLTNGLQPATGTMQLLVELRSVNNRFLDIGFRLPEVLRSFEPVFREQIKAVLPRGKVECRMQIGHATAMPSAAATPWLDPSQVRSLLEAQTLLLREQPGLQPLSVFELISLIRQGVTGDPEQTMSETETLRQAVCTALDQALEALRVMRAQEGSRLCASLLAQCDGIEALVGKARAHIGSVREHQAQEFMRRWREAEQLAGGHEDTPTAALEQRLATELAAYAIKTDIEEELTRLGAHVQALRAALANGGAIGKRLDFLAQELAREANTLGSKSANIALSTIGLELKVLVEQIREQVQNIE